MPIIPLVHRLRKRGHKNIAMAQDLLVVEMYNSFSNAVIHGGTAIWRCYGGQRFSEDIDVYLNKKFKKSESTKAFLANLKNRGFIPQKFREKENSIFSAFRFSDAVVRFEAVFEDKKNYIVKSFEMADGSFINVYTLSPEDLILEKIRAYHSRRKVRDLYDIFFLLKLIQDKEKVSGALQDFIKTFKPPEDYPDLKTLIISGAVPTIKDMLEEIRKWVR